MPRVKRRDGSDNESDDDFVDDEEYVEEVDAEADNLEMLANVSVPSDEENKPRKKARTSNGAAKAAKAAKDGEGMIPCPNTPCTSTFARRNALSRHLRMSCKYGPAGELVGRIPCPMGTCTWWGRPDNLPAHHIAKHGDAAMPPHNSRKKKEHIPLPDGSMPPKAASKKRPRDSNEGKIPIPTDGNYEVPIGDDQPVPVVYGDADVGEGGVHQHVLQPHDNAFLHDALQDVASAALAVPSIAVPPEGGLPGSIDSSFFATPAPILDHHHHEHHVQPDVEVPAATDDGKHHHDHHASAMAYPSAWMRGETSDLDALANVGPPLPPPRQ